MKKCYIMRGPSGCGKSSMAKSINPMAVICSNDDARMKNGVYVFNQQTAAQDEACCLRKFMELVYLGWPILVVDNCNVTARHFKDYARAAFLNGYEVIIVEPSTTWAFDVDELVKRNTHGTPRYIIEAMVRNYQHGLTVESVLGDERKAS